MGIIKMFTIKPLSISSFISNIIHINLKAHATLSRYETLLILRPDIAEEEKDRQLAKLEAFLAKKGAEKIDCVIKGKQRIAYPMRKHRQGIYVLLLFAASGSVAKALHDTLSNPDVETQRNIIKWVNFKLKQE